MSEHSSNHFIHHDVSTLFDQDHATGSASAAHHHAYTGADMDHTSHTSHATYTSHELFHYDDPLKHAYLYKVKTFQLDMNDMHFVKPHEVSGYVKKDGTVVSGYYRDGDGNTSINRTEAQGGGYVRHDPK